MATAYLCLDLYYAFVSVIRHVSSQVPATLYIIRHKHSHVVLANTRDEAWLSLSQTACNGTD